MTKSSNIQWGCAAVGRSGDVSIDVEEAIAGPARWQISIDVPQFLIHFDIPTPSIVASFVGFLDRHQKRATSGELLLGSLGGGEVSIVKDDEFNDRFWLRVSANDGGVWYTLTGEEVDDWIAALREAAADLSS